MNFTCKHGKDDEDSCECKRAKVFIDGEYKEGGCVWEKIEDREFVSWCANTFSHYQNGYLYFSGGIGDQLAWVSEVIAIMSSNKNKIDHEKAERERKEAERAASKRR